MMTCIRPAMADQERLGLIENLVLAIEENVIVI